MTSQDQRDTAYKSSEYDAVIVGSGAGGGMAAFMLTNAGARVLMLEAGRQYSPKDETAMLNWNRDAPLRGEGTPDKTFSYYYAHIGGWQVDGEPYSVAEGNRFEWFRSRMVGGRTNHWARNSFRMAPVDFNPADRDGIGVNWPIDYDQLAPWYDQVEDLLGVYGTNEDLIDAPHSAPGILQKPPKPRIGELLIKAAANDIGIPCVPAHRMILTETKGDGRQPCYWASRCGRGCSIGAAFQTTTSLIPWSTATGRLNIRPNSMVYEVEVGTDGRAKGVHFIDAVTGDHHYFAARIIILAASSCETARILLNSKSNLFPNGLANSSGQVGRNLMDTTGSYLKAHVPALENRPRYNEDGAMGLHLYIPFWLHEEQAAGKLDFPRGYHYELGGADFSEPNMGLGGIAEFSGKYGRALKEDMRRYYGSFLHFILRGEMIANDSSYCEIDTDSLDKFGIPVLKFHFNHSDYEHNQARHWQQTTIDLVDRLGGHIVSDLKPHGKALRAGGNTIHEVGTARMGNNPATSVTDEFGRCWDVDNLILADGSVFSTKAHKNPTLTILALTMRSMDHLLNRMKRREI